MSVPLSWASDRKHAPRDSSGPMYDRLRGKTRQAHPFDQQQPPTLPAASRPHSLSDASSLIGGTSLRSTCGSHSAAYSTLFMGSKQQISHIKSAQRLHTAPVAADLNGGRSAGWRSQQACTASRSLHGTELGTANRSPACRRAASVDRRTPAYGSAQKVNISQHSLARF